VCVCVCTYVFAASSLAREEVGGWGSLLWVARACVCVCKCVCAHVCAQK